MGIGIGLVLIAIGAVLTFAVNASVNGVDIATVGIILMAVGGAGLLLDLVLMGSRRGTVVAQRTYAAPVAGTTTTTTYSDQSI